MEFLKNQEKKFFGLKIISSDFSYQDPLLDGKIKNAALQATSQDLKIGLDMDERIPLRHKDRWITLGNHLGPDSAFGAWMVPSLNLWGGLDTVRADFETHRNSYKWYLHRKGYERGPAAFARKSDGTVDTSKSDTCELIRPGGGLAPSFALMGDDIEDLGAYLDYIENAGTFVYHLGYVSYADRVARNRNFWNEHWKVESGGEPPKHKVHMDITEFNDDLTAHNLPLWDQ